MWHKVLVCNLTNPSRKEAEKNRQEKKKGQKYTNKRGEKIWLSVGMKHS